MGILEKQMQVKDVLAHMCAYGDGCVDCRFFDAADETDGNFFCAIRDKKGLVPSAGEEWSMYQAILGLG